MNSKVVLGCHFRRIGGSDGRSIVREAPVSRGKSLPIRASLIDGITRLAMMRPLHRAVATIRIDHSVRATDIALSVKPSEVRVVDRYSGCCTRNPTGDRLASGLRNALIADAFRVLLTQPTTNSINSSCRYRRIH